MKNLKSIKASSANLEFMKNAKNYNEHLTSLLRKNLTSNSQILDFGAGTGEFALRLTMEGLNITVLEVEKGLAARLQDLGFMTLTTLSKTPDLSFSHAYSLNVLEHIESDVEAIKSIHSKLQSHGTLILYLPAFTLLFSEMDKRVGHYRRYTKKSLHKVLIEGGFEIEQIYYVDFLGFFVTLLYKIMPNRDGKVSVPLLKFYDSFIFPLNKFFDFLFNQVCGKNLFVVARRKS